MTHPSGVIKGVVQVQGGVLCVAVVLCHCGVLAKQRHRDTWRPSAWHPPRGFSLWRGATSGHRLRRAGRPRRGRKSHPRHMSHNTPVFTQSRHQTHRDGPLGHRLIVTLIFRFTHLERVVVVHRLWEAGVFWHVDGGLFWGKEKPTSLRRRCRCARLKSRRRCCVWSERAGGAGALFGRLAARPSGGHLPAAMDGGLPVNTMDGLVGSCFLCHTLLFSPDCRGLDYSCAEPHDRSVIYSPAGKNSRWTGSSQPKTRSRDRCCGRASRRCPWFFFFFYGQELQECIILI